MGTNVLPEIYDHEIIEIEAVLDRLRQRAEHSVNYQGFQDEIKDRLADIGFTCDVQWYETDVQGVLMPDITITGRVDKDFTFDPDQQVHEAVSNVLELPGQEGFIKTGDSAALRRMKDQQEEHGHSH